MTRGQDSRAAASSREAVEDEGASLPAPQNRQARFIHLRDSHGHIRVPETGNNVGKRTAVVWPLWKRTSYEGRQKRKNK